jgi:GTP-binding protein
VIAGRPNVGKSAVFNRLLGKRRSLVHDRPGMTRDSIEARAELPSGKSFLLVDTGGLDPSDRETIPQSVSRRALFELKAADLVLLVLDASAGVLPTDEEAAALVRRAGRPCLVLANKADRKEGRGGEEAFSLGFAEVFVVSAEHNRGFDELLEELEKRLPAESAEQEARAVSEIAVAIVGRPNVGKSSLLNALLGAERALVSEEAGTTRGGVDALLETAGWRFRFVDTAGIRRRGKTERGPEVLSVVAALRGLERCDVALVVFDALMGPTSQDSTVASYAVGTGKGIVLVANKWDLVDRPEPEAEFRRRVDEKFPFARFAPLLRVSAKSGRGIARLPKEIARVAANRARRVPAGELNRSLGEEARRRPPKGASGRPLKVFSVSQTATDPPVFTLRASREEPLYFSEARRFENVLRKAADFAGVPIEFRVMGRPARAQRR